jgi:hypothetical protein
LVSDPEVADTAGRVPAITICIHPVTTRLMLWEPVVTVSGSIPASARGRPRRARIWDALEFRMPAVLAKVADLSDADLSWQPPNGANSIGWLLWHIAERGLKTEDAWQESVTEPPGASRATA